ncbi:MAG: hypothetical protein WEB90_04200 [Gemmatimonadota bacterium]
MTKIGIAVALAGTLAACDSLLEVELPGAVIEEETFVPNQAGLLVASAIASIECAYSDFTAFEGAGAEDVATRTVGWWGGRFERPPTPGAGGGCAGAQENSSGTWFKPLHNGRWLAEQVYDRLENEWDVSQVANREELMATAAIYTGIVYSHFGEFFCEVTADGGPLMSWDASLQLAEQWFTTALGHIAAAGDFEIETDVTTSAQQMAYLLRARARFAQNTPAKNAEAVLDAQQVTQGFTSFVTREAGAERTRVNRVYTGHVGLGWIALLGPINWWTGDPNPATGTPWPAVIPYTGYWELAILPDGRAVSDAGNPITLADAGSVADSRVPVEDVGGGSGIGSGGPNNYPRWEQRKYASQDDDFPLAKWEEAWLIRAQVAGGQTAIDLVNDIRTAHGLPQVTYVAAGDAAGIQNMLIEEIRRTHFLEGGRFWATKLRYNLWFPRGEDADQWNFTYQGGVRMVFPTGEFTQNTNLTLADQASLCPQYQEPII